MYCKLLVCFFVCSSLFFLSSCTRGKENWHENLQNIPDEDKKALSDFFAILIKQNEFGFTIFGNKPVSIVSYIEPDTNKLEELTNLDVHPILIDKGWKIWQKYDHLFSFKNFFIGKYFSQINDRTISNIFIVNKREFICLLDSGDKIKLSEQGNLHSNNPLELLTEFLRKEKTNQISLGIILGYGSKNSEAFDRRTDISLYYLSNPDILETDREKLTKESLEICFLHNIDSSKKGSRIHLEPSEGFASLADEFNYLNCHMQFFELEGTALGLTSFGTPGFVGLDNEPETEKLSESYLKTLHEINNSYKNRNFLEVTLEKLTVG